MLQVASVKAEFLAFYIQANMGSLNRKTILNVAVIGNDQRPFCSLIMNSND